MCARRHSWLILTSLFVWLAYQPCVKAQSWLSDRKRAEGAGIRLGDFELHPGVGAEVGYYTNPFYSDRPQGTASLRISPHIFLSTLREQRREDAPQRREPGWLAMSAGLSGTFQHFFEPPMRDAVNLDLSGDVTLAPERPISFRVTELLRRSALPFGDTAVTPATEDTVQLRAADFTNYYEAASAQLLFQSAGGLLRGGLGYKFGYAWFDNFGFQFNNNLTHTVTANLGWEFLPKTALFYEASYGFQDYTKLENRQLSDIAVTSLTDNHQINTRIGINGAITSFIGATVAVGYAAGFYDTGDDPEGLIGAVEARYTPSPNAELALTFDRMFLPSFQGNFQERNRAFARLRWLFVGALLLAARGGVEFLSFGYDLVQQSTRDDTRFFGDLSGEYRFIDWLALTAQFSVLVDDTDFVFRSMNGAGENPAKFTAVEAWLGLRVFL